MVNAQLEYYLGVQKPEDLSDEEWAIKWNNLLWIRQEEKKRGGN